MGAVNAVKVADARDGPVPISWQLFELVEYAHA
jgi:hypothetical protein